MIDKDPKKIARGILRNAAQKEPPTDLARVLAYLRIHHERPWHLSQDVWEGLGRPARGRTRFKTAGKPSGPSGRWKLAHEIAHHILHGAVPHLQDVWEGLGRPARGRTRFKTAGKPSGPSGRWKLAHEIAHHILHGAVPHLRGGTWETHELEYEADLLAAELLMPDPWLARAVKKAEKEHQSVDLEELARTFQVGRQEMEKRLRQLDLLRGEVLGRM